MKKYRVKYTAYDNSEWRSWDGEMIVEAESNEEAIKNVNKLSDWERELFAQYAMEVNDNEKYKV